MIGRADFSPRGTLVPQKNCGKAEALRGLEPAPLGVPR